MLLVTLFKMVHAMFVVLDLHSVLLVMPLLVQLAKLVTSSITANVQLVIQDSQNVINVIQQLAPVVSIIISLKTTLVLLV